MIVTEPKVEERAAEPSSSLTKLPTIEVKQEKAPEKVPEKTEVEVAIQKLYDVKQ